MSREADATAAAVKTTVTAEDQDDRGQRILIGLLATAAVGFGVAAYPRKGRRGGGLERFRLELVGVSVACVLVLLMVLAGIV